MTGLCECILYPAPCLYASVMGFGQSELWQNGVRGAGCWERCYGKTNGRGTSCYFRSTTHSSRK